LGVRALHWFRSDLRLRDNRALAAAAKAEELVPAFVFDVHLLGSPVSGTPRVRFLLDSVERLAKDLEARGHSLIIRQGDPAVEIPRLVRETKADLLTFNRDYGPYAGRRDARVRGAADRAGAEVREFKDRVMFEATELRNQQGQPYRVYTPYRRAWRALFEEDPQEPMGPIRLPPPAGGINPGRLPTPSDLGVARDNTTIPTAGEAAARRRLTRFLDNTVADYARHRDLPGIDGTSRLSPYLRLGAISIRTCVHEALQHGRQEPKARRGAGKWVDELVWREFYHAILQDHPHVLKRSFRPEFDRIRWSEDETEFKAWCEGRTGYPFVDAAMRQLAATGWMHNRARMVVASFLVKDLLIDWRWGERFFMQHLVDGDPASNNGGWQWAASTGTDAQPYFRIFNPVSQGERFDPEGEYVRRFVPELRGVPARHIHRPWAAPRQPADYPEPIVDHAERRSLALELFEEARRKAGRP
jgi:deoxyribodipyrimidine photo-lyase